MATSTFISILSALAAAGAGVANGEQPPCPPAASVDSVSVHLKSTGDLVTLLSDDCIEALREDSGETDKLNLVEQELSRRRPTRELLDAFRSANGIWSSFVLFNLLRDLDDPEVGRQLKLMAGQDTELPSYLALKYFAERGEEWSLKVLNDHYFKYPVSSAEWAGIAALFGRYHFRPAAENLARSVGAASLNLAGAAHESLCELFPEAADEAKKLETPEAEQAYWIDYVGKHKGQGAP